MSIFEHKPQVTIHSFNENAVKEFNKQMDEIESKYGPEQPIIVHIDSYGGAVHGLSVMYDRLMGMQNTIVTYTSSKAMSAGAMLLSAAGTPGARFASPEASIMVHEISAGAFGDIKDIEDQAKYIRTINQKWMTILAKSMGLKSHKDIRKLISKQAIGQDVHLTAHQAKSLGLIDEVASIKLQPFYGWEVLKVRK